MREIAFGSGNGQGGAAMVQRSMDALGAAMGLPGSGRAQRIGPRRLAQAQRSAGGVRGTAGTRGTSAQGRRTNALANAMGRQPGAGRRGAVGGRGSQYPARP